MAQGRAITVSQWERNLSFLSGLYGTRGTHGAVATFKFVYAPGGIDKFLLAGKKGWHAAQMPILMLSCVERVRYVAPQAHTITVST